MVNRTEIVVTVKTFQPFHTHAMFSFFLCAVGPAYPPNPMPYSQAAFSPGQPAYPLQPPVQPNAPPTQPDYIAQPAYNPDYVGGPPKTG